MERKKKIIIRVAVVVTLGVISGLTALIGSWTPQTARDPELQTTESKLKYLASKEFGNLPDKEKGKYVKSLDRRELFKNSKQMSKEDKKQMRRNVGSVFRAMMKERMDKYSQLATKEEKNAYLDEMIDKMASRHEARSAEDKKKQEERRAERGKRTRSLDKIKNRIETSDPKESAQRTEFFIDMKNRMKERGITPRRGRH